MRLILMPIAVFATYFGAFNFLVFWAWGYLLPAGVAAAFGCVGVIIWGYFKSSDERDEIDRRVTELRDAPRFAVRDELARTFFGGDR